ncbi:MAG: MmgE/PrpD family protein [Alphaproteobacteria bacterium]|nr:MmgE/PrpD family protein [Alphaproteobacteria bacterium]
MALNRRRTLALTAAVLATPSLVRAEQKSLAERLADYADALRYEDLDAATVERVKSHIVDSFACAIAAFDERPVKVCRDVVLASGALASGEGSATVIGTKRRVTPDLAGFANGAAIRYYDLNDAYASPTSGAVHPSDHIGACLAVAEAEKASPRDAIAAIVLAYEVNCRLVDPTDAVKRGWDPPIFSLPAVALAAGKLMKLSRAQLVQAVNIALNDHIPMGQTRTQTNSDWKGLADAEAERNAVFAARLARGGLTGPAPIFEGRKGFFAQVASPAEIDVGTFGSKTNRFKIHECGVKAYPAVVYSQTTIVAGIELAKELGGGGEKLLDRIASLEIATTRRGYEQAGRDREKWTPENRDTADHSLPYLATRAMVDGDVTNETYAPAKLKDPKVLAFMQKVTAKEDPAFAKPKGNAPPTRLAATLTDGRVVSKQIDDMPGFPGQPMTRDQMSRKYRSNVGYRWPQAGVEAQLKALWDLERETDLAAFLGRFSLG